MNVLFEHYRDFTAHSFIYFSGPAAEVQSAPVESPRQQFETLFPLEKATPEALVGHFAEHYHPDKYQIAIKSYVEAITEKSKESELQTYLIKRSVFEYDNFYQIGLKNLTDETQNELERIEIQLKAIRSRVRQELSLLQEEVEAKRKLQEATPKPTPVVSADRDTLAKVPVVGAIVRGVPLISRLIPTDYQKYLNSPRETGDLFEDYLDALNDFYLNPDREKRNLIDRSGKTEDANQFDRYQSIAKTFKEGMEQRVKAKVEWIFFKGITETNVKKELETLRTTIESEYTAIAQADKDKNDITLTDLDVLNKADLYGGQLLDRLDDGSTDAQNFLPDLEAMQTLQPDLWIKAAVSNVEHRLDQAVNNGNEKAVINIAQTYYVRFGSPLKNPSTLSDAKDLLTELVERAAKAGVAETMPILKKLNEAANGHFLELSEQVDERIRPKTLAEQTALLNGVFWSRNEPDRYVLDFVRCNLKQRREMLDDEGTRQKLFEGIKIATVDYQEILRKEHLNRGGKIEGHALQNAARLQALVLSGQQAETLLKNFGFEKAYDTVKNDFPKGPLYKPNLDFGSEKDKVSLRYMSRAELGGFNGVDLGYNVLRVMAGATLILNVAKSRELSYRNPYVWGSAAALGVIHFKDDMPGGPGNYVLSNEPERTFIGTHLYLNRICAIRDIPRKSVVDFCHSKAEFEVIRELNAQKGRFKTLIDASEKRQKEEGEKGVKKPPVITPKDLEALPNFSKELSAPLFGDSASSRVRFEFYKRLLLGQENSRNIQKLQEDCGRF